MLCHTPRVPARRRVLPRARLITFCLLLLVASARPPWHRSASGQESEEGKLKTVSDMVVVKRAGGDVVYVADGDSGAIFYLEAASGARASRPYSDFKRLKLTSFNFKKPSGLAYRQGKLVGCDPVANACFEIDLNAEGERTAITLPSRGLVREPKHVAASESGVLAVASDKEVQYFTPGVEGPRTVVSEVRDIDRIAFDGQTLVVLDEEGAGDLYRFGPDAGPEPVRMGVKAHPKYLPPGVRSPLPDIKDFTQFRGVYYVAGKKELFAVARPQPGLGTDPEVLPLALPADSERYINRVAVSEETVYLSDEGNRRLLIAPRPVPVVVEFPYASNVVADQQAIIIEQLASKGDLARRTVIARTVYNTVTDFVRAELLSKPPPTVSVPANSASVTRLAQLVCTLSGWVCETTPAAQRTQAGMVFRKEGTKIGQGHEVVVPAASAKSYEVEKAKGEQEKQVSLEDYLSERGIIALPVQSPALTPGDIVKIDADQQAPPAALGKCDSTAAVESSSTIFPSEVWLEPERFAAQTGPGVATGKFKKLGIADVAARYMNVTFDQLNLSVAEKKTACALAATDPGAYVIDRVLVAASANYTFHKNRKQPVAPNPKELVRLGLSGTPDPNNKGGWMLPTRLVLGYRAFRLKPGDAGADMEVTYLEPIPATTKVYVQELTLLVDAAKVAGVLRELNGSNAQRFYAFSDQDSELAGEQKSLGLRAGAPPQSQAALASRAKLRELINFPEELSKKGLEGIKVGVVEDPDTIDTQHPAFFNAKGEWSWGADPPPANPARGAQKNYHGTKVASIIGAKSGLLGLVPSATLVKIDSRTMLDQVKTNMAKGVRIYNVSLHFSRNENFTALIDNVLNKSNSLLVVPAGDRKPSQVAGDDEVVDYWAGIISDKPPPVSWLTKLSKNVIVVGASANTYIPARYVYANLGKKYVHLLAPGELVYSAAGNDDYDPDAGSSLAVPQVTAAAAMLRAKGLQAPWIKAVLIYTANWSPALSDDAWGGLLNAQRAYDIVANNYPNNIYFPGETAPQFARLAAKDKAKLTIKEGTYIDDINRRGELEKLPQDKKLLFKDVLRLQRLSDGSFHVVYLENGLMRMFNKAELGGFIKCAVTTNADGVPIVVAGDACLNVTRDGKEGVITFNSIQDYVGKPQDLDVKFPRIEDGDQ